MPTPKKKKGLIPFIEDPQDPFFGVGDSVKRFLKEEDVVTL